MKPSPSTLIFFVMSLVLAVGVTVAIMVVGIAKDSDTDWTVECNRRFPQLTQTWTPMPAACSEGKITALQFACLNHGGEACTEFAKCAK